MTKTLTREEIEALLGKATDGPWTQVFGVSGHQPGVIFTKDDGKESPICRAVSGGGNGGEPERMANARLIAAAPTIIRQLLDRVEELEGKTGYCAECERLNREIWRRDQALESVGWKLRDWQFPFPHAKNIHPPCPGCPHCEEP